MAHQLEGSVFPATSVRWTCQRLLEPARSSISRWRRTLPQPSSLFLQKGMPALILRVEQRAKRASRYALADIADDLKKLLSANREIAVHGIDAWRDSAKGRDEREQIQQVTEHGSRSGVRMHWLYFDAQAPIDCSRKPAFLTTQRLATTRRSGTARVPLKFSSIPMSIICWSCRCTSWTRRCFIPPI